MIKTKHTIIILAIIVSCVFILLYSLPRNSIQFKTNTITIKEDFSQLQQYFDELLIAQKRHHITIDKVTGDISIVNIFEEPMDSEAEEDLVNRCRWVFDVFECESLYAEINHLRLTISGTGCLSYDIEGYSPLTSVFKKHTRFDNRCTLLEELYD